MVYNNFDTNITDKYGIVIEGWPLPRFLAPTSIGAKLQLELLYTAWQKGTARFRVFTPDELINWREKRLRLRQQELHHQETPGLSASNSGSPPPPPEPLYTVTGVNGNDIFIPYVARKPRADKGKKRGKRMSSMTPDGTPDP